MMEITELIDYLLPQTGNSPLNGIKDQISFCFVIYNLPNKVRVITTFNQFICNEETGITGCHAQCTHCSFRN